MAVDTQRITTSTVDHPLTPLTGQEIEAAIDIVRREKGLGETAKVVSISLWEPPKSTVLAFRAGDVIDRAAEVIIRDIIAHVTYEAVVSVTAGVVRAWTSPADIQNSITMNEILECERTIKAHPQWQEAMRRRGVTDFALAQVDPWPIGHTHPDHAPTLGRKILGLTWVRLHPEDNGYARPVEGLIVHFDYDAMTVTTVEDHGVTPIPPRNGNYAPDAITDPANFPYFPQGVRSDLKPLEIVQPDGPSFAVDGYEVRWQKWSLRIGFTYREGLVLYQIGYDDGGRRRPIIYRASLCEMFIPYGDAAPTHNRKSVFDMGEFGLGMWTNSLERGCDCLGDIRYFDATINDDAGKAVTIPNAVCLHEEDTGLLWKHSNFRSGDVEVRRSRRLVVSSIVTVGNYEYAFYWYFYQDGGIEYEIKLSGVISDGAVAEGAQPRYGEVVAPGVYGPNHQHFFSVRLDMMLDGERNSVYEANSASLPWGDANPLGNAWVVHRTLLARESEAQRTVDAASARYWIIANPNVRNALDRPVAYRLMPGANVLPFCQPDSPAIQRAGFATKHLWVTAYDPAERYAAGDYPYQHPGGAGLPSYAQADRPVENTDVVVWYTCGAHHVVRPEDWPVMPVTRIGFHLKPDGFFDGNPALDLPPSTTGCDTPNGH